jgi:hypothetical protein
VAEDNRETRYEGYRLHGDEDDDDDVGERRRDGAGGGSRRTSAPSGASTDTGFGLGWGFLPYTDDDDQMYPEGRKWSSTHVDLGGPLTAHEYSTLMYDAAGEWI